jgi:hypothetical protein
MIEVVIVDADGEFHMFPVRGWCEAVLGGE